MKNLKYLTILLILLLGVILLYPHDFKLRGVNKKLGILKAPKEKIIDHQNIKEQKCNNINNCSMDGDIEVYTYDTDEEVPAENNEIIKERTENSQTFDKGGNNKQKKIYSGQMFIKHGNKWNKVDVATSTKEDFDNGTQLTLLDKIIYPLKVLADSFYSGSGDCRFWSGGSASWSGVRDAAASDSIYTTSNTDYVQASLSGGIYYSYTIGLYWDTSSIPDNATITSGNMSVFISTNSGNPNIDLVPYFPDSFTSPTVNDFNNISYTRLASTVGGAVTATTTFTLNAAGLSNISLTGNTGMALIGKQHFDNTPPTNQTYWQISMSEDSYWKRPTLTVNYSISGGTVTSNPANIINFE